MLRHIVADRVFRALADLPALQIDAAHPGLGAKLNKGGAQGRDITFANTEFLLGQNHDAAAFRRFVGQRSQLRGIG